MFVCVCAKFLLTYEVHCDVRISLAQCPTGATDTFDGLRSGAECLEPVFSVLGALVVDSMIPDTGDDDFDGWGRHLGNLLLWHVQGQ